MYTVGGDGVMVLELRLCLGSMFSGDLRAGEGDVDCMSEKHGLDYRWFAVSRYGRDYWKRFGYRLCLRTISKEKALLALIRF